MSGRIVSPEPVRHLYLHVPFCARKCDYCAFYSEAVSGPLVDRYVAAICLELRTIAGGLCPRTIFFGGGTPTLLSLGQWTRLLTELDRLGLASAPEWTVECNPATLSLDKAKLLLDHGVNRISLGVQSLNEDLLDRLGRVHSREMVFKSYDLLRRAGCPNVNLDLMFAIPGQTLQDWDETLSEAVAMGSDHLSAYEVIYEEDTPLFQQLRAGRFDQDEDLACDMYERLVERAGAAGFAQYEVANFARVDGSITREVVPARACQHNVNYWRGGAFYGCGPSATSYVNGARSKNWSNTARYCERVERHLPAAESIERLTPRARAGETAAFGLRLVRGWEFAEFAAITGIDLRGEWQSDIEALCRAGHGELTRSGFRLTPAGLRFADAAAASFLRPD
jgi:oxygen-independent coproporphyrinogen-3 oxidase